MNLSDSSNQLNMLLKDYEDGLYTDREISGYAISLLAKNLEISFLETFPSWLRLQVIETVNSFGYEDEIVSFGRSDPEVIKNELLMLKEWMMRNAISNP
jgi:hypothetical protein